jgi:hypothetical protein
MGGGGWEAEGRRGWGRGRGRGRGRGGENGCWFGSANDQVLLLLREKRKNRKKEEEKQGEKRKKQKKPESSANGREREFRRGHPAAGSYGGLGGPRAAGDTLFYCHASTLILRHRCNESRRISNVRPTSRHRREAAASFAAPRCERETPSLPASVSGPLMSHRMRLPGGNGFRAEVTTRVAASVRKSRPRGKSCVSWRFNIGHYRSKLPDSSRITLSVPRFILHSLEIFLG